MQQKEYKALLVDKIQMKDMRGNAVAQRKASAIEFGARMHQALQNQFFETNKQTKNMVLPVPFEKYKKDFDAIKEPKKKMEGEE